MKSEVNYSLLNFRNAFLQLKDGSQQAKDQLEKDGVIQRFEFTFELLWKALRICLREKGMNVNTPKDSLVEAFRLGWIQDEATFLLMLEDRNQTSHVYSQKKADEIFVRIRDSYLPKIKSVLERLETLKK